MQSQFCRSIADTDNPVDVGVEFCLALLRRCEGGTAEARGYAQDSTLVDGYLAVPRNIFLLAVPAIFHLYLATDRVSCRHLGNQRTVQTGYKPVVLDYIYIVDAAFSGNIQIYAPSVTLGHVTHESIVETEVYVYLVSGCTACVSGTQALPDVVASETLCKHAHSSVTIASGIS